MSNKTKSKLYSDVTYACHHKGEYRKRVGKGERQTSTAKLGCPFTIQFRTTGDGQQLELNSWTNTTTKSLGKATLITTKPGAWSLNHSKRLIPTGNF